MTPATTSNPMPHSPSILRTALALLNVRLVLKQIALGLLVFLLYVFWLRMPDASAIEVLASFVLALIVIAVAGAGESALVLQLSGSPRTFVKLLRGTLLLIAGVALWFAWSTLFAHLDVQTYLYAGYLNSRFPHSLRNVFSFEHIALWLGWLWRICQWIGACVIALLVFAASASARPIRSIGRALRSATYWIAAVLATSFAVILTASLIDWTPGHGLRVEMLSLVMRLTLAALGDASAICLLLAILAACVRQAAAPYSTPAGTPDESQPRTAEIP